MAKRISITFRANGEGVLVAGGRRIQCLGKPGVKYPKDLTVTTANKYRVKYSGEYTTATGPGGSAEPAKMPHAILIWGQRGIYIHEWPGKATLADNGGVTSGCIHLSGTDAPYVFNYVDQRTRITLAYPW